MTKPRTEKHEQARSELPEELRPAFDDLVADYLLFSHKRLGKSYVSYVVLADLVTKGWRLSDQDNDESTPS